MRGPIVVHSNSPTLQIPLSSTTVSSINFLKKICCSNKRNTPICIHLTLLHNKLQPLTLIFKYLNTLSNHTCSIKLDISLLKVIGWMIMGPTANILKIKSLGISLLDFKTKMLYHRCIYILKYNTTCLKGAISHPPLLMIDRIVNQWIWSQQFFSTLLPH